ncbi:ImcF-related family protein [Enterobacter genomosp. O]|uniref:ImcF-related family protein n=1 Tax=Enterobacter genomosp. O TaxID=2364150 RepID=UPI0009E45DA9|nr:ImcF-related family protein [Enterobacter genomosp. O]
MRKAWTVWGSLFSALLLGGIASPFWLKRKFIKKQRIYKPDNILGCEEKQQVSTSIASAVLMPWQEIRKQLSSVYGFFWHRKTRILLVTGSASDVELLTPKLTQELWQEDHGTLLLWGGDPAAPADTAWLTALRKLRHRPADGMVWVTSAFDRLAGSDAEPAAPLTPESMDALAHALKGRCDALGWRLPLYVWSLHPRAGEQQGRITQPVGCQLSAACKPEVLARQLSDLTPALTTQGIQQICDKPQQGFLLALADQLMREPETLTDPLSVLLNPYRPLPLAGVVFSPATVGGARSVKHHWGEDNRWDAIPASAQALPAGLRPRKPGVSWTQMAGVSVAALMVLWGVSMAVSFVANRHLATIAQEQVRQSVTEKQPLTARLHALTELQKTLARLQYRAQHGVPWYARGGLSQNDALLAALFPRYGESALPLLRDAAAEHLAEQLQAFVQLPPGSPLRERMAKPVYDRLRLYLMLSRPEKMDAAWFSATLMRDWLQREGVASGVWQGRSPALYAFYAANLASHPQWRLHADDMLVSQTRTLLVRQMGVRNSESTLYQKMLAQVANQYADMRLADMTGDTDAPRLFTTDEIIPGMFTRQAWEGAVQPAIDKVVNERREEMDWVLSDSRQPATQQTSPEALKQRLTVRYFADFSTAWLDFLNSLHWQRAVTLSDAIDQLTLMADVRQSPLVALMNTLNIQGRSLKHRPVMGTHATDVNGQVLLRLSTDNPEEVRGWLPGGDLHTDLMALLHVWLGAHLDVRKQLCVARHLLPDAQLSCNTEQTAQVGRTAVLRPLNPQQNKNRNDIITIHLGRFQRVRENIQRRKNDEDGDYRW